MMMKSKTHTHALNFKGMGSGTWYKEETILPFHEPLH